jgi:hypothetical protein
MPVPAKTMAAGAGRREERPEQAAGSFLVLLDFAWWMNDSKKDCRARDAGRNGSEMAHSTGMPVMASQRKSIRLIRKSVKRKAALWHDKPGAKSSMPRIHFYSIRDLPKKHPSKYARRAYPHGAEPNAAGKMTRRSRRCGGRARRMDGRGRRFKARP